MPELTAESWRTMLLIATILGFVVTVAGLASAYVAASRQYAAAGRRIGLMRELADQEQAAHAGLERGDDARRNEINLEYEEIYSAHDLVRPTYDNIVYLAQHESQRLLGLVLTETRRDFLIAGFGLLVSTAASAGSLYLSTS